MRYTSLQRNALLIATLSSFLTPFMGSSVIVSLPRIGHDLSMNVITLSWISTAYLLAAAAFLVPFGRLSDIHGRKRIFLLVFCLTTSLPSWGLSPRRAACSSSPGYSRAWEGR